MATQRQKKLAHKLVQNLKAEKPLSAGELLENVGYSKSIAEQPKRVIEAPGVQQELVRMGFSEDVAKQVVGEILIGGENDNVKLKAAELVFKVHGSFAPEKKMVGHFDLDAQNERVKEAAKVLNHAYRTGDTDIEG